jgi:hypothetical protein
VTIREPAFLQQVKAARTFSTSAEAVLDLLRPVRGNRSMSDDSSHPFRGRHRSPAFRRVSHGLQMRRLDISAVEEHLRDLKAWRLVLPPDAVFTHVTGAWLYGWWLPQLPEHLPTFAATAATRRPRRAGLVCSRLDSVAVELRRHGLPVDSAGEVLLRAARDLALLDLVPMIDRAFACDDVTLKELETLTHSRRPGSRRLRRAVELCDGRSESAWESLLRIFHVVAGVAVEAQVDICDGSGAFVARADLVVVSTGDLHEYDGHVHDEPAQRAKDLRRGRRIQETGRVRRGFTASDLVTRPAVTMAEVMRAAGRPFDRRCLETWTTYLQESCLTPAGRRRLENRWLATRHWSQTPA